MCRALSRGTSAFCEWWQSLSLGQVAGMLRLPHCYKGHVILVLLSLKSIFVHRVELVVLNPSWFKAIVVENAESVRRVGHLFELRLHMGDLLIESFVRELAALPLEATTLSDPSRVI
jgi:hypothetical protein